MHSIRIIIIIIIVIIIIIIISSSSSSIRSLVITNAATARRHPAAHLQPARDGHRQQAGGQRAEEGAAM